MENGKDNYSKDPPALIKYIMTEILLGVKTREIPMIRHDSDCRGSAASFSSLSLASSIILRAARWREPPVSFNI